MSEDSDAELACCYCSCCQGHVVHSELHGEMKMKSFLVGTPVIRVSLNDSIDMCEHDSEQTGRYISIAC